MSTPNETTVLVGESRIICKILDYLEGSSGAKDSDVVGDCSQLGLYPDRMIEAFGGLGLLGSKGGLDDQDG